MFPNLFPPRARGDRSAVTSYLIAISHRGKLYPTRYRRADQHHGRRGVRIPHDFRHIADYRFAMPKTAYRPLIEPKLRTSVPRKVMREAVQKIAALRKTNPAAYRTLIGKHAETTIRIVPG